MTISDNCTCWNTVNLSQFAISVEDDIRNERDALCILTHNCLQMCNVAAILENRIVEPMLLLSITENLSPILLIATTEDPSRIVLLLENDDTDR